MNYIFRHKYKLLKDDTITVLGKKLYRIKAVKDFGDVKEGDLGGYVESEYNLSHEGNCWIYDNAQVLDNASVIDNAKVKDNARVFEFGHVIGEAFVCHAAQVYGCATVKEEAKVLCKARVFHNATISGEASVSDRAVIFGDAIITDEAKVYGDVCIHGSAHVRGKTELAGRLEIFRRVLFSDPRLKYVEPKDETKEPTKKYELLKNDVIKVAGKTLYRIKALREFQNEYLGEKDTIKVGQLGGYVESEDNLSHEGTCWIYEVAKVFGKAVVKDDARVCENAQVFGKSVISDNATIFGESNLENAVIGGNSIVDSYSRTE